MNEPADAVVRVSLSSPRSYMVFIKSLAPLEQLLAQAGETGSMVECVLQDKPLLFTFLSQKSKLFQGLLHQDGREILPIQFAVKLNLQLDPNSGNQTCLGSPTLLQALLDFDEVCRLLDQCRLNGLLEIDAYHGHLRVLDGSVHHAFHRLENGLRRRLGLL